MSGALLRLVCTTAVTASAVLVPAPAVAARSADTAKTSDTRSVSQLLTDLQRLYRQAEKATETYNGTVEKLKQQQREVARLDARLARARLALRSSRREAGLLARQQYQSSADISPYLRLLLARDPQRALDQSHVLEELSREQTETVDQLTDATKHAEVLARKARTALDERMTLTQRQKRQQDDVQRRLKDVEKLLASLSSGRRAELTEFEHNGTAAAQKKFLASGALSESRPPTEKGDRALRYAVEQIGKPYQWGGAGPRSYDCSGLTSQAWKHAGRAIPRTSQEQWAQLPHVPLTQLRPGDLVIYFPEATHVALYLGDGMVVQAPRPGTRIKVSPIAANPVLGAVRPDPGGQPLRSYEPPSLPQGSSSGSNTGYSAAGAPATDAR